MADLSTVPGHEPGSSAPFDVEVVQALNAHAVHISLTLSWEELVGRLGPATSIDKKATLAHRRTLLDPRAYPILQLIWKESEFISEAELYSAGLERAFTETPLTCHSLAVASCGSAGDLGKVAKRLQKIVRAAEAFGLLQRVPITTKKYHLAGTGRLHLMMKVMAQAHLQTLASRFGLFGQGAST